MRMYTLSLIALTPSLALAGGLPGTQVTLPLTNDNSIILALNDPAVEVSNGAGIQIFVGRTRPRASSIQRGLIRFDVSSIPASATVVDAQLNLNVDRAAPGSGAQPLNLHRATASWGEGESNAGGGGGDLSQTNDASWRYRFYPTVLWTTPGGDFVSAPSASLSVLDSDRALTISSSGLIGDVALWVSQPSLNFGWLLKGNEVSTGTSRAYWGKGIGAPLAPSLSVTYLVAPTACNPADIAGSGATYANGAVDIGPDTALGIDDFIVFLAAFTDAAGCPGTTPGVGPCNPADVAGSGATYSNGTVDIGPDGELGIDDFIIFLAAFSDAAGCP